MIVTGPTVSLYHSQLMIQYCKSPLSQCSFHQVLASKLLRVSVESKCYMPPLASGALFTNLVIFGSHYSSSMGSVKSRLYGTIMESLCVMDVINATTLNTLLKCHTIRIF